MGEFLPLVLTGTAVGIHELLSIRNLQRKCMNSATDLELEVRVFYL